MNKEENYYELLSKYSFVLPKFVRSYFTRYKLDINNFDDIKTYIEAYKNKGAGVYVIINLITGFRYFGHANDVRYRKNTHFIELSKQKHCNTRLQEDYNLYGEENFLFKKIYFSDNEYDPPNVEMEWINKSESSSLYNIKQAYNFDKIKTQHKDDRAFLEKCLNNRKKINKLLDSV